MIQENNPLAYWHYTSKEWDDFVTIERANKKEDNYYFGIGIVILGTVGLMLLRDTGFWTALFFSLPLAILIPWLRMRFSYRYLKKGIQNPEVKIFHDSLLINSHKIELRSPKKRVKTLKILNTKQGMKLLEFDVQWITAKGPTNDEFRVPIPDDKEEEVQEIISQLL